MHFLFNCFWGAQTYKIDENGGAIAILEINPISMGHTLVVQKGHSEKIAKTSSALAKRVATKIKAKLKPKDIIISPSKPFGHGIISILPIYESETINSPKQPAKPDELQKIQKLLEKKQKSNAIRAPKIKKLKTEKLWLPQRIP